MHNNGTVRQQCSLVWYHESMSLETWLPWRLRCSCWCFGLARRVVESCYVFVSTLPSSKFLFGLVVIFMCVQHFAVRLQFDVCLVCRPIYISDKFVRFCVCVDSLFHGGCICWCCRLASVRLQVPVWVRGGDGL